MQIYLIGNFPGPYPHDPGGQILANPKLQTIIHRPGWKMQLLWSVFQEINPFIDQWQSSSKSRNDNRLAGFPSLLIIHRKTTKHYTEGIFCLVFWFILKYTCIQDTHFFGRTYILRKRIKKNKIPKSSANNFGMWLSWTSKPPSVILYSPICLNFLFFYGYFIGLNERRIQKKTFYHLTKSFRFFHPGQELFIRYWNYIYRKFRNCRLTISGCGWVGPQNHLQFWGPFLASKG